MGNPVKLFPPFHPAWLAAAITAAGLMLLLGLWLVRRGWRGRRVGDEPNCATCGYNLAGIPLTRCPECGADVAAERGRVTGRRVRGRVSLAAGTLLFVVAAAYLAGPGWKGSREVDWYTIKPMGYVLDDLASPTSPSRQRAWNEVVRRAKEGPLALHHRARLVDVALAEQASGTRLQSRGIFNSSLPTLGENLVQWLMSEADAGRLNAQQRGRLCEQTQTVRLDLKPKVLRGEPVPFVCSVSSADLCDAWYPFVTGVSASIDGGPFVAVAGNPKGGARWQPVPGSIPVSALGRHEVAIKLHVEFWSVVPSPSLDGFYLAMDARKALMHAYEVTRTATVEVIDPPLPASR